MTKSSRVDPDDVYRCCGRLYYDQIEYERHLAAAHGHLRDTLPRILEELDGRHY